MTAADSPNWTGLHTHSVCALLLSSPPSPCQSQDCFGTRANGGHQGFALRNFRAGRMGVSVEGGRDGMRL